MTIKKIILKPFQLKLKWFVLSTEFFIRLLCCQWLWRRKFCSWDQASFSCGQCSFSLFSSRFFNNQWNVNEKLDVGPSLPEGWYFESRQGHRPLSLLWQWNYFVLFLYKVFFFFAESAGSLYLSKKLVKYRIKQLLDEVLLTETLIILVSQKPNLIIVLLYIVYKKITTNRPSHGTQFDMHYACNLQIIFTNLLADN